MTRTVVERTSDDFQTYSRKHLPPRDHRSALESLQRSAGNAAVGQLLEGDADLQVQRQLGLDPRLLPDMGITAPRQEAVTLDRARASIVAWLEPQRAELENRARNTAMGFASTKDALTMPGLTAMIRDAVPDSRTLQARQVANIVREWIHVGIPEHMTGGQISDAEVKSAVESVLGKPGTVRVEHPGAAWLEVTAGGIEIGRDDSAAVDATMTVGWDGSVGASLSLANVKGSFQISPDRTWQASIAIPAAATPSVLGQLTNVFGVADRSARSVAGRIDASGGHLQQMSTNILKDGLSPVKDAIDTLTSVTDREHRVSVGITAGGDFQGSISVQATITITW